MDPCGWSTTLESGPVCGLPRGVQFSVAADSHWQFVLHNHGVPPVGSDHDAAAPVEQEVGMAVSLALGVASVGVGGDFAICDTGRRVRSGRLTRCYAFRVAAAQTAGSSNPFVGSLATPAAISDAAPRLPGRGTDPRGTGLRRGAPRRPPMGCGRGRPGTGGSGREARGSRRGELSPARCRRPRR